MDSMASALSSTLFLDRVGKVVLILTPAVLSWSPLSIESDESFCCPLFQSETETEIRFSDVYAVEFTGLGLINAQRSNDGSTVLSDRIEMYQFVVHGARRGNSSNSPLTTASYIFGHKDFKSCRAWFEQINVCVELEVGRPKNLMVFVNPICGKGKGRNIWGMVAPLFTYAKIATKVIVTQRTGHAYDIVKSLTDNELRSFNGIVTVGGDGLFNEVLNGLLSSRHKTPYPPAPSEVNTTGRNCKDKKNSGISLNSHSDCFLDTSRKSDDLEPLLSASLPNKSAATSEQESCSIDQSAVVTFPNDWFRIGIIPAGSTDAIVISTTGTRDPVTSALQIILGRKISLDVAQVVRWKTIPSSTDTPSIHYASSFAGYGFFGDVNKESEKYRWMGPSRYGFTGTKVFLEHRSYEAEIAFIEAKTVEAVDETVVVEEHQSLLPQRNPNKRVCRANCTVCTVTSNSSQTVATGGTGSPDSHAEELIWLQRKGRFLSIGAAVISCRNERAPDGLVVDAHLSDGFLHLILVKDCPQPLYLWHLIKLSKRDSNPLDFSFVEHHKTRAFTFTANHDGSVWNLDGELLRACQVTVSACRGLINLFASGPED